MRAAQSVRTMHAQWWRKTYRPLLVGVLAPARRRTFVPFTQCAWCGGVSFVGHYFHVPGLGKSTRQISAKLPLAGRIQISMSHGICPSCADRIFATARHAQSQSA